MKNRFSSTSVIIGIAALGLSGQALASGDSTYISSTAPGTVMQTFNDSAAALADSQYPPYAVGIVPAGAQFDLAPIEFSDPMPRDTAEVHADHQYPPYAR